MKRLAYFLIAMLLISALPEMASAQSNDPFEQQVIQTDKNSKNTKNQRRRRTNTQEVTPAPTPTPVTPQPKPEEKEVKPQNNGFTISNPCSEWLDFELVSINGSLGSQKVSLTFKITSHDVNKRIYVGGDLISYDCEGEEHNRSYSTSSYDAITDVPIKSSFEIPGKINPTKTTVMPVISFNIGDCRIEIRNAPIDWK